MEAPVDGLAVRWVRMEGVHDMYEVTVVAQVCDQFRLPVIATRLPGDDAVIAVDCLEECRKVPNVFARRQERLRALENNHTSIECACYVTGALPCQPDLFRRVKTSVKLPFFLTDSLL